MLLSLLSLAFIVPCIALLFSVGFFAGYYIKQRQMLKLLTWKELFYATFFPLQDGVEIGNKTVAISYVFKGTRYRVFLPYSAFEAVRPYTATLISSTLETDVTQQPGIKYCVSASDLGGQCIKIEHEDGTFSFPGSNIPSDF